MTLRLDNAVALPTCPQPHSSSSKQTRGLRRVVGPVHLIEIDDVGSQPPQRVFDLPATARAGTSASPIWIPGNGSIAAGPTAARPDGYRVAGQVVISPSAI